MKRHREKHKKDNSVDWSFTITFTAGQSKRNQQYKLRHLCSCIKRVRGKSKFLKTEAEIMFLSASFKIKKILIKNPFPPFLSPPFQTPAATKPRLEGKVGLNTVEEQCW